MFCPNCGRKVDDGINFCPSCGSALSDSADALQVTPKPSKNPIQQKQEPDQEKTKPKKIESNRRLIIALVCVLVLVLTAAAVTLPIVLRMVKNHTAYMDAQTTMESGDYQSALTQFTNLENYKDSADQAAVCQKYIDLNDAIDLINVGNYDKAKTKLEELGDFEDAKSYLETCQNMIDTYNSAIELKKEEKYSEAYSLFESVDAGYRDTEEQAASCIQEEPATGELYRNDVFKAKQCELKLTAGDYLDISCVVVQFYSERDELVSTIFIKQGENATIKLPSGRYQIKVSYGEHWFGKEELFGEQGETTQIINSDNKSDLFELSDTYGSYTLPI